MRGSKVTQAEYEFEADIVLGVLDAIERDPSITQRFVAQELGIALGLTNAYLKRCVRKGLVKVSQVPSRRYAYYLTPKGFAEKSRLTAHYLSHSFSFFRRARTQCADLFQTASARKHRRFALLGDGDLSEIAMLVARDLNVTIVGIIPVQTDPLRIERSINKLGRVDAIVVTALVNSREAFDGSVAALGEERVYVPPLLRARRPVLHKIA